MNKNQSNKTSKDNVNKKILFIVSAVLLVVVFALYNNGNKSQASPSTDNIVAASGDLTILKSDITEQATFYPYKSNDTYMEIIAIKASDGSVRTALNTCQVCYKSGRGYYEQKGDVLVCKNCGNQFTVDQIELIKGGCNPIPITKDLKTESSEEILITADALVPFEPVFARWKR